MKVLVWGMGYVGSVTAAALAQLGHDVVGVEPNPSKVAAINAGQTAVKEPGLAALIESQVADGRLRATTDPDDGLDAEVSLVCVGTPTDPDGTPDLSHVTAVATAIGRRLPRANGFHVLVLRSTVPPGTTRNLVIQAVEEASGLKVGEAFGVAVNPEFLREGSALADFERPSMTVIGADDDATAAVLERMYAAIEAPVRRMTPEEAELLKLVNNAFHALKIGFANEVGRLCERLGIDSHTLMDAVVSDTRLNISPAYLRPGFAFGGSCLPKDLRSLSQQLRMSGAQAPILEGVIESNRQQVHEAIRKVKATGARRIAVLGLAFKPGTDDLRESPIVDLVNALWRDGYEVKVHDPDVNLDEMVGANRAYVERQLPQIEAVLTRRLDDALDGAELVIVGQRRPEFTKAITELPGGTVLDLVRIGSGRVAATSARYVGMSW